jgi:lycopene cyclase domain-containing protein
MTYLQFHLVFLLPVIAALGLFFGRNPGRWPGRRGAWSLGGVMIMALVYTAGWDNYLVYREVWGYGADRVMGTIGYVPIEEYLFFVLQPLLGGLWFYLLLGFEEKSEGSLAHAARWVGAGFYLAASGAGSFLLQFQESLYLGLILVWAGPVLAGQWAYAGHWIWPARRLWMLGVGAPTVYLWIADRTAIGLGIWYIDERTCSPSGPRSMAAASKRSPARVATFV